MRIVDTKYNSSKAMELEEIYKLMTNKEKMYESFETKEMRVVHTGSNGPSKAVAIGVTEKEKYQYTLPPDTYSAGYYERLTDGNWNDLKEIDLNDVANEYRHMYFNSSRLDKVR